MTSKSVQLSILFVLIALTVVIFAPQISFKDCGIRCQAGRLFDFIGTNLEHLFDPDWVL